MDTYEIEPDGQGGFQIVERQPTGKRETVVGGFASWGSAQDLINDRLRLTTPGTVSPKGWT